MTEQETVTFHTRHLPRLHSGIATPSGLSSMSSGRHQGSIVEGGSAILAKRLTDDGVDLRVSGRPAWAS